MEPGRPHDDPLSGPAYFLSLLTHGNPSRPGHRHRDRSSSLVTLNSLDSAPPCQLLSIAGSPYLICLCFANPVRRLLPAPLLLLHSDRNSRTLLQYIIHWCCSPAAIDSRGALALIKTDLLRLLNIGEHLVWWKGFIHRTLEGRDGISMLRARAKGPKPVYIISMSKFTNTNSSRPRFLNGRGSARQNQGRYGRTLGRLDHPQCRSSLCGKATRDCLWTG